MLKSSHCDYIDAYILAKGTTIIAGSIVDAETQRADKGLHVVMPMYNLIEYSNSYAETLWSLWQYDKDVPSGSITAPE